MNFFRVSTLILLFISCSCTTILVQTTGEEGIQEDPGERTAGAMLEDQSIETKVKVNMRSQEPAFRQSSFDVISHNGVVLLAVSYTHLTLPTNREV